MNFLSLSKPFKFSLNCLKAYGIFSANKFYFSRRTKSTQLILFNNEEIEKIHMRQQKKKKTKSWEIFTEQTSKFKVSLVGLPNCGKSSLFNCLVGQRLAIVDKQYGLTRDRRQITILKGLASVIDTPGVEVTLLAKHCKNTKLKEDIFQQTLSAISQSNIIFFIIDSKKSITQDQISLARYLKAFNFDKKCQIILVCNKCDGGYDQNQLIGQTSSLGFQKIFFCSAQEGTGIFQLLSYIDGAIPEQNKSELQKIRRQRKVRFEELVKKLKSEIKQHNEAGDVKKSIKIKQWENDFRKINPDPQENQDLDYQNFQDYLVRPQQAFSNKRGNQVKNLRMKSTIKICFIGRPNVGKSSLINQILGSQKLIVSDIPHTTRDSLATKIIYKNRKIELIDTAGLNTPRIQQNQQQYLRKVQISTMLHVQESHVVVYVLDAFSAFKIDDFKLIQRVIQQGRPVIIVVNKWEVIKQQYKYKAKNYLMKQIDTHLGQLHGYPIVYVSAKLSNNLDLMMDKIVTTYDKWNSRISTGLLNNWLQNFKKLDNLPKDAEMTLKINYLIQARVRPPHYIFFVNNKAMFKDNYLRFVAKNLAEQFQMDGIPLRHSLRSTNNNQNKLKKKTDRPKKFSKMRQKMEQLKKKYGDFSI